MIKDLIAAAYTPMNEDRSINLEIIPSYSRMLKSNGTSGVFVNGSTGDFVSLTTEERKQIIEAWSNHKEDGFTIINHIGHTSYKVVIELAEHSADKVDAISLLAPYYFEFRSLKELVDYCGEVAGHASNIPFYYYHIPDLSKANFKMVDFMRLAKDSIPNFAGIKFTKNNLIDYRYCNLFDSNKYDILFGVDELFLPGLALGAKGWVGSTYNHLAPLYLKIMEEFKTGNHETAAELQTKAMQFVDILNEEHGFGGSAKSFMKVIGIDCGPSRYPHRSLSEKNLEKLVSTLKALGIMQYIAKA